MQLHCGDCLEVLPTLPAGSVDAVVTDPPAGISFMGAEWDRFGGRGNDNSERDRATAKVVNNGRQQTISPYPHSQTNIDPRCRAAFVAFLTAALAECLRVAKPGARLLCWAIPRTSHWTGTAIEDAGWVIEDRISHLFGQGFPKAKSKLKPACEDWWLARKPSRGVPALNIDGCRVEGPGWVRLNGEAGAGFKTGKFMGVAGRGEPTQTEGVRQQTAGRWPANVILDEAAGRLLDEQSGERPGNSNKRLDARAGGTLNTYGDFRCGRSDGGMGRNDSGGASRFFYCAKASRKDRGADNRHPTVKPHALMRWLCRLITPPGGVVLDPFMGSGSTGKAALAEGLDFIGIERDPAYFATAERRICEAQPLLAGVT